MRKLQSPHAAPEISLPESKCSLLRRAYPNEGNAEAKIFARDAGSQPVRGCILAHAVPTPHAPLAVGQLVRSHIFAHHVARRTHFLSALSYSYHSNGGMGAFLHPNEGNVEPVDSPRAAENRSSIRRVFSYFVFSWGYGGLFCTRLMGMWSLPIPCAAENRSSMRSMLSYFVFSWGGWGLCPHVNPWPLTFCPHVSQPPLPFSPCP